MAEEAIDGLEIYLEAAEMSEKSMLSFNYTVTGFSQTSIDISLQFEQPEFVSVTPEKENLIVRLTDLRDSNGDLITDSSELSVQVPPQIEQSLADTIETAGETSSKAVIFNFLFNLMLRSSISSMLASIIGI